MAGKPGILNQQETEDKYTASKKDYFEKVLKWRLVFVSLNKSNRFTDDECLEFVRR